MPNLMQQENHAVNDEQVGTAQATAEPQAGAPEVVVGLERFRNFYNEFNEAWLERLEELYSPDFEFRDAFHSTQGDLSKLKRYFTRALRGPAFTQFIVDDTTLGPDGAYVRWTWRYRIRERDALDELSGVTHLRFAEDGRVRYHRDYFDSSEVFVKFPLIGHLIRYIQRRMAGGT